MLFTTDVNELARGFAFVSKALPSKTITPILKNVLLVANNDGVTLRGSDGILHISVTIPADVEKEGDACIDPIVFETVSRFDKGLVKFSLKKRLIVTQNGKRHNFSVISAESYPNAPTMSGYLSIDSDIFAAFRKCNVAVSDAVDQPILQAYYLDPCNDYIMAGDGNQITNYEIGLKGLREVSTPPAKILNSVASFMRSDGDVEVAFTESHVGFRTDSWEVVVANLAGKFPDVARTAVQDTLNSTPSTVLVFDKAALRRCLEICSVYSSRAFDDAAAFYVGLSSEDGIATITMSVPELVDMVEPLELAEHAGQDLPEFLLHPKLLLEAVGVLSSDQVEIRFYEAMKPFIVIDREDENFCYLQVAMAGPRKEEVEETTTEEGDF